MKGRFITEKQIAAFAIYLESEEKSKNTCDKYIRDVRAFAAYVGDTEITKETVIAYKNKLLIDVGIPQQPVFFSQLGRLQGKINQAPTADLLSRRKGNDQSGIPATCKYSKTERQ